MSPRRISSNSAAGWLCAPAKRGGTTGTCASSFELRAIELRKLHEIGEVERALDPVDLRLVDAQAVRQPLHHLLRGRRAHLDADDVAEAPLSKLGLDRFEEICRVVGHLEVGVPGHTEDRPLDDGDPREEPRQEVRDDLLERHVQAVAADARGSAAGPRES